MRKVQELVEKAPQLPSDIKWHFIGHLQSNKAKHIARIPNLFLVESLDSVKLANTLDKALPEDRAEPLRVMVQVNTSGEDSKSGVEPEECTELVRHVATSCSRLRFIGLMTIGRIGDVSPACFERLAACRDKVIEAQIPNVPSLEDFELSMGMSGDFEVAIQAGSTSVRVGSTIFGARDYGAAKVSETSQQTMATVRAAEEQAQATARAESAKPAQTEASETAPPTQEVAEANEAPKN